MATVQEDDDPILQYVEEELERQQEYGEYGKFIPVEEDSAYMENAGYYRESPKFIPLSTTPANYATYRGILEEDKKPQYISVTRFAALRQVNRSTVIAAIDKGFLQADRTNPGGMWRIRVGSIKPYLRRVRMSETAIDEFMEKVYHG